MPESNPNNGNEWLREKYFTAGDNAESVHIEDPSEFEVTESEIAVNGVEEAVRPLHKNKSVPRWSRR